MTKEISLMFSGGIDSTYCAAMLTKDFDKIHLLNYSNGYGHYFFKNSEKRYRELEKRCGNKFIFKHSSSKPLFEKVLVNNLQKDSDKYSSGFTWCMGCKLSMHAESIIYNKLNDIKLSSDGSSYDSREMVEQTPFSLSLIIKLYSQYGIEFKPVAYKTSREMKIKILKKMRLRTGIPILSRNLGIQPKCVPGELYYSPQLIMGNLPHHQSKEIYYFYKDKMQILESYIKQELVKRGAKVGMLQS